MRTRVPPVVVALVAVPVVAAPPAIEVSEDGRHAVDVTVAEPPASPAASTGGMPFGTAPDWLNDFRRQVGGLQVADMNGDGLMDVVVGCYQSNSFPPYDAWFNYIYYNTGSELEATPSWVSTDEVSTGDIRVADFNGDGFLDIFSANGGAAMAPSVIYFGSATGPSTTPGWSSAEPGLAWNNHALPFDIDGDGDMDLLTANQGNSQFDPYRPMYMFRNTGSGLETVPSWASAESSIQGYLAAGDLDGDGDGDIAVSKWSGFESAVYLNLGGTPALTPTWTTGDDDTDRGVAWSDVDGDGDDDLALGHDPTQLFTNTGGVLANTWNATGTFFGPQDFGFFDADDDGDDDIVEIHFGNGVVNIYRNDAGTFATAPSWSWNGPHVGTAIGFGDINGDGRTDLVAGASGNDSVVVFYAKAPPCPEDVDGDGTVGFSDVLAVLTAWGPCIDACPADLDDDNVVGFSDLLAVLTGWGDCG